MIRVASAVLRRFIHTPKVQRAFAEKAWAALHMMPHALASLVLLFAISFGYGAYVEPVSLHYAPLPNVELKQNSSTIQGRVVVQLGRFIVLQRADKSTAAIDMSNVLKISRPEDARMFWRIRRHI